MALSFSRLPLEVMVIILEYAPDLPSIYNFICASANANAAFKISPASILENAIERSIPEFKHLAHMIAIFGSFSASSAYPTFEELVSKYNLSSDMLTILPRSSVFTALGSRYLVLTAYRIENLRHICFISLLQNIHEVIWSTIPTDKQRHFYPIKQSKNGVYFQAAAWWSPSWAEKTRITRALWKLMIYWNIRAICPSLTIMDDYIFSQCSEKIQDISPCIGPDSTHNRMYDTVYHEAEEMNCVLAVIQELLDYPHDLFTPFISQNLHKFQLKEEWTSSTIYKETLRWKFEEPKPMEGCNADHNGESEHMVNRINTFFRQFYWRRWYEYNHTYHLQFPDYLGLCIWDYKRLGYLGLAYMYDKFLEPWLGPLKCSNILFVTSTPFPIRWEKIFLWEITRLPGGQLRQLPEEVERDIQKWKRLPRPMKDTIEQFRVKDNWGVAPGAILYDAIPADRRA